MATVTSVTKHFATAKEGFTTTLASTISSGAATVPLNSVSGYSNGEVVALVIEPTDTNKKQVFTGTVDTAGVQITGVVWTEGTNQTHNAGVAVVDYWTATHQAMMVKGLLALGANQAGTITPKVDTSINDTNGNEVIKTPATASAVNEITVTNAATGADPRISATGGDSAVNLNLRGKGLAKTVTIGAGATTIYPYDYVASGCVWSGDAYASTRNASMTSGVVVINGNPITVATVTARSFTASKDTYIDVLDNGDGTGLLVYTEVANNAASPALAANSVRIAIIVTGASNIAASTSISQGGFANTVPTISSQTLKGFDSLGNIIYPKGPSATKLTTNPYKFSTYLTAAQNSINGQTKVLLDTKIFDTNANFDATTNRRFTAPIAGYYFFNGGVAMGAVSTSVWQALLYKNGSVVKTGTLVNAANNFQQSQVSGFLQLAAGDYIELYIYASAIVALTVGAPNTYLDGYLVSAS